MYNYFLLIGILYKDIEIKKAKSGKNFVKLPLLVSRSFKNSNGEYDADLFQIYLWDALADIASDNFKKGTKLGVKGRLQTRYVSISDEVKIPAYDLIAERLVFFDPKTGDTTEKEYQAPENEEFIDEEKD